jgi:Holliday junction resolvasome RuvABC endonuclease subunit
VRALGIDPSSYAVGYAVVERAGDVGALKYREQWLTGLEGTKDPEAMADAMQRCFIHTRDLMHRFAPDVVVIEQLSSAQNLKTVRAIMYFEAITHVTPRFILWDGKILKPHVGEMRKAVFGKGNMTKADCAELVRERLGITTTHLPTPRSRNEVPDMSDDETDAYAYACFGVGATIS